MLTFWKIVTPKK